MNKPYKLSGLVTIALGIIIMCTSEPISDASKVVLYIELQAVLQVTAQQLALHLDPLKPEKIEDIVSVLEEINKLMNNPTTGGGIDGGHGIVVVLNILKHLRSSRKLSDLLVKKYDSMIRGINCLESFHVQAKVKKVAYTCSYYTHLPSNCLCCYMYPIYKHEKHFIPIWLMYNNDHWTSITIHS